MALNPLTLSLLANAAGHSSFHYFSPVDSIAIITGANYFGPVANIINRGDFMSISSTAASGGGNAIVMVAASDNISNVTLGTAQPMGALEDTPPPPPAPPNGGDHPEEPPPPPPATETASHGRQRASR